MRKLSIEEIETIEESGTEIAKIKIDGLALNERDVVNYQILVNRCRFKPDSKHKKDSLSDGYSYCYTIALMKTDGAHIKLQEAKFFTQCTESDLFIHVGNYMGTVFMMNTLEDRYYLKDFDSTIEN